MHHTRSKRIAAVAVVLAVLLAAAPALAETLREEFRQVFPVNPGAEVEISNVNGSLDFQSWDRDEVLIEATKAVKAIGRSRAQEALEALRIEVESSPDAVRVKTFFPHDHHGVTGWLFGRGVDSKVSYHVTLPREVHLDARTVNGNVSVSALSGKIDARTTNGEIRISEASGKTRASTTNGSIRAELREVTGEGDCAFSTTNGGITVWLPETVAADVDASTVNGAVDTDFAMLVGPSGERWRRKRLEGEINGGGSQLTLSTVNGSIQLRKLD